MTAVGDVAALWDVQNKHKPMILQDHTESIYDACFSADGQYLVTASSDGTAKVWDTNTGERIMTLGEHRDTVWTARFSPDGRYIITGSEDTTARLWDLHTEKTAHIMDGHDGAILSARFSSDGRNVAIASFDGSTSIWDTNTGKRKRLLEGHEGQIYQATFSPDGNLCLTTSADGTAKIWNVDEVRGSQLYPGLFIKLVAGSETVDVLANGQRSAIARSGEHDIIVFDGKDKMYLNTHMGRVSDVQLNVDGSLLLALSSEVDLSQSWVHLWQIPSGRHRWVVQTDTFAHGVCFSHDSRYAVIALSDGTVRLLDNDTGSTVHEFGKFGEDVLSAQLSSDGKRLLTVLGKKVLFPDRISVWKIPNQQLLFTLNYEQRYTLSALFDPSGERIFVLSHLFDTADPVRLTILNGLSGRQILALDFDIFYPNGIEFSPEGRDVLAVAEGGKQHMWRAAPWKLRDLPENELLDSDDWQARFKLWKQEQTEVDLSRRPLNRFSTTKDSARKNTAHADQDFLTFGVLLKVEAPSEFSQTNPHHVAQKSVFLCSQGQTNILLDNDSFPAEYKMYIQEFGPDLERFHNQELSLRFHGYRRDSEYSLWYYYLLGPDGKQPPGKPWILLYRSKSDKRCALTGIFMNTDGEIISMPQDLITEASESEDNL